MHVAVPGLCTLGPFSTPSYYRIAWQKKSTDPPHRFTSQVEKKIDATNRCWLVVLNLGAGEVAHQVCVLPPGAQEPAVGSGRDGGAQRHLTVHARQDLVLLLLARIFVDLERRVARDVAGLLPATEEDLLLRPIAGAPFVPLEVRDLLVLRVLLDEPTGHPVPVEFLRVQAAGALHPTADITGHEALLVNDASQRRLFGTFRRQWWGL